MFCDMPGVKRDYDFGSKFKCSASETKIKAELERKNPELSETFQNFFLKKLLMKCNK